MTSFKNNLLWIIFMVLILGTLIMLLIIGPSLFDPPVESRSSAIEQMGEETGMAEVKRSNRLRSLGAMLLQRGELERALEFHRKSLALEIEMNNQAGIAIPHDNLALVLRAQGKLVGACAAWDKALEVLGPPPGRPRFSMKGRGVEDRLRERIDKRRAENDCPE